AWRSSTETSRASPSGLRWYAAGPGGSAAGLAVQPSLAPALGDRRHLLVALSLFPRSRSHRAAARIPQGVRISPTLIGPFHSVAVNLTIPLRAVPISLRVRGSS